MSLRGFFSLPVMIVAVLALALGSVGTAVAGPALTNGKVKSIAAKVVKKAAPKLSVAHATTATTAGDSTNLAGQPATTYLDRVVQTTSTTATPVPTGDHTEILSPVAITAPAGVGFVLVHAVAAFSTGSVNVSVWFSTDGPCTDSGTDFNNRQYGNTTFRESVSLSRMVPVTPGVHTFRLCVSNTSPTNTDHRVLTAETVALGS
jgi:hypothetical protein